MVFRTRCLFLVFVGHVISVAMLFAPSTVAIAENRLFPAGLPQSQWKQFDAVGYANSVAGVVYRTGQDLVCGLPLGAVDTGCVDLELDGTFGYMTNYNSHVPRRGKVDLPFLGLTVGDKAWVLSTRKFPGATSAESIDYWGHFPIVDLEYQTTAPVDVGLRAWAPFIVGDEAVSNTPGAVFEVHLRNPTKTVQQGSVVFSFPGPTDGESGSTTYTHKQLDTSSAKGWLVGGNNGELAVGVIGSTTPRVGGSLGADGAAWGKIAQQLPLRTDADSGVSLAAHYTLQPGASKVVRFVAAWYFPTWKGAGTNDFSTVDWGDQKHWYTPDYSKRTPEGSDTTYHHMFASRYRDAAEVAERLAQDHTQLLGRIIAWQEVLYQEEDMPIWLQDSLVNILHLITECGMWAQAGSIGDWCKPEDGVFGMNESPRDCPQIECIPCSFYGNQPLVYFYPKLAMSTMRAYINYMTYDGAAPWVFGGCTARSEPSGARNERHLPTAACAMNVPCRGYQTTTNGISFVAMADRLWVSSGYDQEILQELYPWVKKNTIYTMTLRAEEGPDGVVSMPTGNVGTEWFEHCQWKGIVAHVGGLHLAQLRIAERMAEESGDTNFVAMCRMWFDEGSKSMEKHLWNGRYYINFFEPSTDEKSDLIFSYQLDGEWITDFHGLPYCFPKDRVQTALATIREVNSRHSDIGFLSFLNADGSPASGGEGVMKTWYDPFAFFNAELFMLAMNYMYEGQVEFGLPLAEKCMNSIVCKHLHTWDMPNMIRGDTGEVTFGKDYYQMLMLWSLPAAVKGQDMGGPTREGGLVARMIAAAN